MNLSIVNKIADTLAEFFNSRGIVGGDNFDAVYANDTTPSSELPDSYLEIVGNGPLSTRVSQAGIKDYVLMLMVNIKLLNNGAVNTIRETYLLDQLDDFFGEELTLDKFHYSIDKNNMVYSGKSLIDGYSTKIININVKIY